MMKRKVLYFIEYKKYNYSELSSYVDDNMFHKGYCIEEYNKIHFCFVGILVSANVIIVVFPKGHQTNDNEKINKNDTKLLMEVFFKYSKDVKTHSELSDIYIGDKGNLTNLSVMIWLIEDFLENGYYYDEVKKFELNRSKKIHWSKTIKSQNPALVNRRPVYLDLVTEQSVINNNEITLLHKYALQESLSFFGWLYDAEVDYELELPFDKNHCNYLLEVAQSKTFLDRESELLKMLKGFFNGSNNNNENTLELYATKYFHWIWEHICLKLFSSKSDEVMAPPNPYWNVNGEIVKSAQIPDAMFVDNDSIYILDAKYYSVDKAPRGMPGWGDLVKQFFYSYTLKQRSQYKNHTINNVFLFPLDHSEIISYLGFATIEEEHDLGKIKGFIVSPKKAMSLYVKNKDNSMRAPFLKIYEKTNSIDS